MEMNLKGLPSVDRNRVKAFFAFDLLVLPSLVKVMFVLGLIGIFVGGAALPFRVALHDSFTPQGIKSDINCGAFLLASLASILFMVIGMVWWRVVCESMIILFKIHDVLAPKRPEEPKPPGPELAAGKPPEPPKTDLQAPPGAP